MLVPPENLDDIEREIYVLRKLGVRFSNQLTHADQVVFRPGPDDYSVTLVMISPLASRGNLDQNLKYLHTLDIEQLLRLIYNIVCGIATLHQSGFTHNDLKPENILLFDWTPKIADFGMVVLRNPRFRRESQMLQTPTYRAPEYLCADRDYEELWPQPVVTPQGDMWSLGIILLEMLDSVMTKGRGRVLCNFVE